MFILASASPRRRDLLLQIGADFAAVTSGAEESLEEAVPHEAVVRNALAKACAVAAEYPEHTGVAWVYRGRAYTDVMKTIVQFAPMPPAEIERYVRSGEPMGKAGGYAIQGRAAMYIEEIHGSYSNVVGLPLQNVAALAREAGISLYDDHADA